MYLIYSAADLYIKDYLHPNVEAGHEEARPLRRWCPPHLLHYTAVYST